MALALLAAMAGEAMAQREAEAESPTAIVRRYMRDRDMLAPLAADLRRELATAPVEARRGIAEELGRVYAAMMEDASPEALDVLRDRAKELLESVPEAESFGLRIDLAKAAYRRAETIAERDRLRLATPEEKAEALDVMRSTSRALEEASGSLARRIDQLERAVDSARDDDAEAVASERAEEARRLRSLASYYAGWASYYEWLLGGAPRDAEAALMRLGPVLNAVKGRPASVDRVEPKMLRFEHVARAAIACALSTAATGDSIGALRWIELIDSAEERPRAVDEQLAVARLIILAGANRWADVDVAVRRLREPAAGSNAPTRLPTPLARLLSVLAFEAIPSLKGTPTLTDVARRLGQTGLGDLVAAGEIGQVLDLVSRYDAQPVGDSGFVVTYVRGLSAFERARSLHAASGSPDQPATDEATINQYRQAAGLLDAAAASSDATGFARERVHALITRGLALFHVADHEPAAQAFQAAASVAANEDQRRDALWFAVVTLDRAVSSGRPSLVPARDQAAMIYLRAFPDSDNAARLALRQLQAQALPEAEAIAALERVQAMSPLYSAARRELLRLLYRRMASATGEDRAFAALRVIDVASEVVRADQALALAAHDDASRSAANTLITRARQLADALASLPTPDPARIDATITLIEHVAEFHGLALDSLRPELTLRRLQAALAHDDDQAIDAHLAAIAAAQSPLILPAQRLAFDRMLSRWRAEQTNAALARRVIQLGTALLDGAIAEGSRPALRDAVAAAAFSIWESSAPRRDAAMRDLALRLDTAQIEGGSPTAASLRRVGILARDAGRPREAFDAWNNLLLGLEPLTPAWWEARVASLSLLATLDPTQARAVLQQHRALYTAPPPAPHDGPWRDLTRQLDGAATPPGGTGGPNPGAPG